MTSVGTFLLAAAFAVLFSWLACRLPGLRAVPIPERWHRAVITPVTGGVALFLAFVLAVQPALHSGAIATWYKPVILVAVAAFALGLFDDVVHLRVAPKLAGQTGVALLAAYEGSGRTGCARRSACRSPASCSWPA